MCVCVILVIFRALSSFELVYFFNLGEFIFPAILYVSSLTHGYSLINEYYVDEPALDVNKQSFQLVYTAQSVCYPT